MAKHEHIAQLSKMPIEKINAPAMVVGQQVGFRALFIKDQNVKYYDGEDGRESERVKRSATK